ncbi:hypothetical protein EDB81DRAFT_63962 [Dactylonectria macrodidyma]|uniref:ADF-H domain-containing protein n=1 Tax=Dactylonectria macrodidyma TaxID=307937 RepID=A0A9P9J4B9_9HYPO|nr:hypothetical protein EDB81DRAFT_63962 [Dactylonectria macrodidyma]
MSLNGLDDPKVQEAHGAAAVEPGGWFLLKYASRDEIELLGRGSGGIVEVRTRIAEYEETSPLYGFLRYRRRNVLIKYLPEDCSRLIQARVAVHFNAVCERFSPYDTTFEITTAKELKDTKLSAACSLHAASGSNSSATSSIRRRRLVEIAEEEEEEQQQRASKRQSIQDGDDVGITQPLKPDKELAPADPVKLNSELASSPEERKFSASSTSEVPNFVGVDETPGSEDISGEGVPRTSSQSGRPDYLDYNPYSYSKPKVKLAPRPSLEAGGRPRTAGGFRPVSQMPAGLKLFGKGSKRGRKVDGTATIEDEVAESDPAANTLSIPEEDTVAQPEITRPATSSGLSTAPSIVPAPPAKTVISPEKARLMKAMKLREKRKKKNMTIETTDTSGPEIDSPVPSVETIGDQFVEDEELETQPSIFNADSAIGLDASSSSMNTDQASELTQLDSHPASPVIASSEPSHSTKASSLSESTDETVQAKSDDIPDDEDVLDIAKHAEGVEQDEDTPSTATERSQATKSALAETVETLANAQPETTPQTEAQPAEGESEEKQKEPVAPIGKTESIPTRQRQMRGLTRTPRQ